MKLSCFFLICHSLSILSFISSKKSYKIAVIGGGSFGTAISTIITKEKRIFKEEEEEEERIVCLYVRNVSQAQYINKYHRNPNYFSSFLLSQNIIASNNLKEVLIDVNLLILSIPVQQVRNKE